MSRHPCISLRLQYQDSESAQLSLQKKQVAQLSQRDRAAGWISFGKSRRRYSTDIIGVSSTTTAYKVIEFGEITQNNSILLLVIEVGQRL